MLLTHPSGKCWMVETIHQWYSTQNNQSDLNSIHKTKEQTTLCGTAVVTGGWWIGSIFGTKELHYCHTNQLENSGKRTSGVSYRLVGLLIKPNDLQGVPTTLIIFGTIWPLAGQLVWWVRSCKVKVKYWVILPYFHFRVKALYLWYSVMRLKSIETFLNKKQTLWWQAIVELLLSVKGKMNYEIHFPGEWIPSLQTISAIYW